MKLSAIANELKIEENEVESLLVTCIVDGQIRGRINQVKKMFELFRKLHSTLF